MNYIAIEGQRQGCAFGFFDMDGNLIGYRQDMFNTIGTDYAKIYSYTVDQVKIVLKCINDFITTDINYGTEILKLCGYGGRAVVAKANEYRNQRRNLRDGKEFEVRVIPADAREPFEPPELGMWLIQAPSLEPLESYKFNL